MEFGIEKCAMILMKSLQRHRTDVMELLNQNKIRTLAENETYKYLGIKQEEMKDKIHKIISQKN